MLVEQETSTGVCRNVPTYVICGVQSNRLMISTVGSIIEIYNESESACMVVVESESEQSRLIMTHVWLCRTAPYLD